MRDIFTYPNDLATNHIDPDYYGDANSGFLKRINDFVAGNYKGHQTAIVGDTNDLIKAIAKNENAQYAASNNNSEVSGQQSMTFYELWRQPLLLWTRELAVNDITNVYVTKSVGTDFTELTVAANADGAYWAMPEHTQFTLSWSPIGSDTDYYVEHMNGPTTDNSVVFLNTDDSGTRLILDDTDTSATSVTNGALISQHVGATYTISGNSITNVSGGTHRWHLRMDSTSALSDNDVVQFHKLLNDVDGNDVNVGEDYFIDVTTDGTTVQLFEDSGPTNPAEQTTPALKTIIGGTTFTGNFYSDTGGSGASNNNSVTIIIGDSTNSDATTLYNTLLAYQNKYTFTSGIDTFNRFPVYIKTINSTGWSYASGYRFYEGDYDKRTVAWAKVSTTTGDPPNQNTLYYRLHIYETPTSTISKVNFDNGTLGIDMRFQVPESSPVTSFNSGTATYLTQAPADATATVHVNETARYRVDGSGTGSVKHFGAIGYKKRTGESTYEFSANFNGRYYIPDTPAEKNTQSGETQAQFTFTNNNFHLASCELNGGNWGMYITQDDMTLIPERGADTYTPPARTIAEEQDVWDLDSEWNNTQFNVKKTFPTTVTPQDITVRVVAPTATTSSQNGTKYSRTAGYSKYSIDVTYPPMTAQEYLEYNSFINVIQGQKHPFYFDILQNNTKMFGDPDAQGIPGLRYREAASAGDVTVLIEGYASDQANAIKRGELFITDNKHGNIKTAGSSTDANIYGEAKFRYSTPLHSNKTAGEKLYRNPQHIIVSLDVDTVEVTRDTAGFYYLSLSFTADEWK